MTNLKTKQVLWQWVRCVWWSNVVVQPSWTLLEVGLLSIVNPCPLKVKYLLMLLYDIGSTAPLLATVLVTPFGVFFSTVVSCLLSNCSSLIIGFVCPQQLWFVCSWLAEMCLATKDLSSIRGLCLRYSDDVVPVVAASDPLNTRVDRHLLFLRLNSTSLHMQMLLPSGTWNMNSWDAGSAI